MSSSKASGTARIVSLTTIIVDLRAQLLVARRRDREYRTTAGSRA
jgi:hypothetical protein